MPTPGAPAGGAHDLAVVIDGSGPPHAADPARAAAAAKAEAAALAAEAEQAARAAAEAAAALQAARAASAAAAQAAAAAAASAKLKGGGGARRPRTYYIDWLRSALTVVVVLHHCVTTWQGSSPWAAKGKNDNALWLLSNLFVGGNQAYFMTLFFFISGIFVPGSYNRKGPRHFLLDRTLRLLLPCLVYSLLATPFMNWWAGYVKDPSNHPSLGDAFARWLKPSWPTTYMLPTGPPWFVYMLWWFNVGYVVLRVVFNSKWGSAQLKRLRCCFCGSHAVADEAAAAAAGHRPAYTARQALLGGAALIAAFWIPCYVLRVFDYLVFGLKPILFVQRGPFVQFMPDYFPVYALAFGLGVFAGPKGPLGCVADLLHRLPAWGGWLLVGAGVWWVQAGFVPNTMMHAMYAGVKGPGVFAGTWLLRTLVEQSFAVAWSAGLLVFFREHINHQPNLVGDIINGAAYAAFLIHPVIIPLYAGALMPYWFPSAVVAAAAIMVPVVCTTWLLAAGLKAIPGAGRIL